LFAVKSAAEDRVEAIGGDARVALIEERRRTTLLDIEDGATRYLQLRAGISATQQALASYRERHRSSMMARASEAFRTISRGAYTGLVAQPGKDGDTLIAISAEGGSKAADKLSKARAFSSTLRCASPAITSLLALAVRCRSSPTISWRHLTISALKRHFAYSRKWGRSAKWFTSPTTNTFAKSFNACARQLGCTVSMKSRWNARLPDGLASNGSTFHSGESIAEKYSKFRNCMDQL
jgi:hypothetical protein